MGGTFDRLVAQGHEVHVAYQTSGNIAVSNEDAIRFLEVTQDLLQSDKSKKVENLKQEFKEMNPQHPKPRGIWS